MTKLTSFMRAEHRMVSDRIVAALKALEVELGVTFSTAGGIYGQTEGVVKIAVSLAKAPGVDALKDKFVSMANYYGFKATDYQRVFWHDGTQYRLVGFNAGSPKFQVSVQRVYDGKTFKFTRSGAVNGLAAEDRKVAA